jgi:hypothetical protein
MRSILSVGFGIPGGMVEHVGYDSNRALLDADIIVFQPRAHWSSFYTTQKPPLDSDDS